jgi:hypothetical protein
MYVDYEEYKKLGFSAVAEADFPRYEMKAEAVVRRFTFDRITDEDLRAPGDADGEARRIAEMNKYGVCEIIDACHAADMGAREEGPAVRSFSNNGYSETYEGAAERRLASDDIIAAYVNEYFTPEQRYRGV